LSVGKNHAAGMNGGIGKGYIAGGATDSLAADRVDTVERTTYSNDTTASVASATLPQIRAFPKAITDGSSKAYLSGGYTTAYSAPLVNTTDKLTFSTETSVSQTSANLSEAKYEMAGMNGGTTKGYFAGGMTDGLNGQRTTIEKVTFSTDVMAASTSTLITKRGINASISDGSTKAYIGGGESSSLVKLSSTEVITFSSDTASAVTTADLSTVRLNQEAISNGSTHGYFGGGTSISASTNVADKTIFSTDTTSNCSSAYLSANHSSTAGLGVI
jgi:hypothetical protein